MADDKKNIPEAVPPAEAPAPTVENAVVPEQPAPEPDFQPFFPSHYICGNDESDDCEAL